MLFGAVTASLSGMHLAIAKSTSNSGVKVNTPWVNLSDSLPIVSVKFF